MQESFHVIPFQPPKCCSISWEIQQKPPILNLKKKLAIIICNCMWVLTCWTQQKHRPNIRPPKILATHHEGWDIRQLFTEKAHAKRLLEGLCSRCRKMSFWYLEFYFVEVYLEIFCWGYHVDTWSILFRFFLGVFCWGLFFDTTKYKMHITYISLPMTNDKRNEPLQKDMELENWLLREQIPVRFLLTINAFRGVIVYLHINIRAYYIIQYTRCSFYKHFFQWLLIKV